MDPATTVSSTLAVNAPALYVGMELESAARAREFVNAYAIRHNFAVKNGDVYNKDKSLLLLCKCAKLPSTRRLQPTKGATDDEGLNRQKEFRSMLCDCPWMVRFKKQLNDTWIVTQLVDHHENHQLQGINPLAYPENRSLTPEARETMLDLVRHSNASYTSIASVINTTYGLSLLGRDVYNRSYDYTQKHGTSTAKVIESLRDEGYIYRIKTTMDNTLETLFFCKLEDVQKARLYGQLVVMDTTYKTNRFRLPLVNIVTVDNNLRTVRIALCFISSEQTHSYTWVLQQLKDIVFPVQAPGVIITDADKALIKALTDIFPTSINQLCRWHIEQNIMKNCRKYFSKVEEFDRFMKQIQKIASSTDVSNQNDELKMLSDNFPMQAVGYFLDQWWINGMCERWVEIHLRKYSNFGISTSSRVEGSHGAMKSALTSSSGTIYTAAKKINRRGTERSQQLSIIGSNKNLFVRQEIRNQVETAMLCTRISRFALEIVYAEVMKKVQHEEEGVDEICSCTIRTRYLLPCSHQIQSGLPIDVGSIHPRWRVQVTLPPIEVPNSMNADALAFVKDPPLASARKGRPKGTRRLPTSAETTQRVSDRIEKVRRCRPCNRIGHNRRTCPKLEIADELALKKESSVDDDEGTTVQHDDDSKFEISDDALCTM